MHFIIHSIPWLQLAAFFLWHSITAVLLTIKGIFCFVLSDSLWPQAPLPMGFPRQKYHSGLPFPSPRDLPNPGIQPISFVSPALAGGFFCHWAQGSIGHLSVHEIQHSRLSFLNRLYVGLYRCHALRKLPITFCGHLSLWIPFSSLKDDFSYMGC